jgi:hypothetical protein
MSKAQVQSGLFRLANHWRSLAITFLVSLFLSAGIYSIIEPYTMLESLVWSAYMLTSTGLGCYNATSAAGQILSIIVMIWGPVLLLALFTGAVVNALRIDPDAFTDSEQKELLEGNRIMVEWIKSQTKDDSVEWPEDSLIEKTGS